MLKRLARWVLREERKNYAQLMAYAAGHLEGAAIRPALVARLRKASAEIDPSAVQQSESRLLCGIIFSEEIATGAISADSVQVRYR